MHHRDDDSTRFSSDLVEPEVATPSSNRSHGTQRMGGGLHHFHLLLAYGDLVSLESESTDLDLDGTIPCERWAGAPMCLSN